MIEFFKKGFKTLRFKGKKPSPLGDLEEKVMNIIWEKKKATVRDVLHELNKKENFAYTTIMTIMDRLYKKGLLKREKKGLGYIYYPVITKEEFEKKTAEKVITELIENNPELTLAAFQGAVEKLSKEEIDKLYKIIEEKRKKNERKQ